MALVAALIGGAIGVGSTLLAGAQEEQENPGEATIETPDWTKIAEQASPSVAAIQVGMNGEISGLGSGFVYGDQGHVITNNHVVAAADAPGGEVQVVLSTGATVNAQIIGRDPETDIAVLDLEQQPEGLTPLPVGQSSELEVGEPVMALGNPLGLADTVTTGIVSALNRPVTTTNIGENPTEQDVALTITNAIQTDAAINPGNSGGPLVNGTGEVIGVNSSAATLQEPGSGGQGGSIGIGFAIPIYQATNIADQLISTGEAKHPHLGVSITSSEVEFNGISRGSAMVSSVSGGSPAEQAGIEDGDHIIAVNGTAVNSAVSLQAIIRSQAIGDTVTITLVRGGQQMDLQATLASE
nr:trypsin-like peptidase domain-containing protein [Brevibacterium daeguense]